MADNSLLTARDVELRTFKKVSFGGYAIAEVEEFLNQIADDLEAYVLRIDERDNRIRELEDYVRKQESMTDMIKNALIQAQKAAKDMEEQANAQKNKILSEARANAERELSEARSEAERRLSEANIQAGEIVTRARASADNLVKESQEIRAETERRWESLEQDLALRKQEVSEESDRMIDAAQAEADRMIDEASRRVDEYGSRLRVLNLQKQQFLRDTVSLLINFGRTIDKAQQELETEMSAENDYYASGQDENKNNNPDLMERFRKNMLEGVEHNSTGSNMFDPAMVEHDRTIEPDNNASST